MANQINFLASQWNGDVIQEDVAQLIYQITPEDTPLYNTIGDTRATNVKHEWLTRSLGARLHTNNVVAEGDVFALGDFDNLTIPSRVDNTCMILREMPRVTETSAALALHGITDLIADQMQVGMTQHKYRIENAMWVAVETASIPASGGDTTVRSMQGLTPSTDFDATLATNATDNATTAQCTESQFNATSQAIWSQGGSPADCFVGPDLKRLISTWTASSTKFMPFDSRKVVNTISVYESDFHTINIHLSRDISAATDTHNLVIIDRSFFKKAWLRPTFAERLPRVAGDTRMRIESELCIEWGNEAAGGIIQRSQDPVIAYT